MKKLNLLAVSMIPLLALSGCNKPSSSEETSSENPSSSEPAHTFDVDLGEAPTYEEDSLQLHYYRKDGKYTNWNLWLWESGHDGAQFDFNGQDDWGVIASYPLSRWSDAITNTLGFIVRKGEWQAKDYESDRFIDFNAFEKDENNVYHVYIKTNDGNLYTDTQGNMKAIVKFATFTSETNIAVSTNLPMTSYALKVDGNVVSSKTDMSSSRVDIKLDSPMSFTSNYTVDLTFKNGEEKSAPVSKTSLLSSESFGNQFNYDGQLGAIYTKERTTFKVWSPLSSKIVLKVYNTGTPASLGGSDECQEYEMTKGEKGVFSYVLDGDLEGKYYTYTVTNSDYTNREVVDPYAKSAGVNGSRGMIVDFSKTNPEGWDAICAHQYDRKELTVYETHVADVTSSSTWTGTEANRKLFKGMYESGTTYAKDGVTVKTGFDHIKELGVNAVQIIPLFDQANDEKNMTFNWGYNPLNYNCVEGGYSSNPENGYVRIQEFKELVKAYHDAGINIIMDVVYNHVAGALFSNFDVLMPGYYYRYTSAGGLSNGSGCGNETASENYMMRKFIVDSTKFWAEEYKLGGFRFDLMGLHDLETMKQVASECKKVNPSIAVYGEPWSGGTSTLPDSNSAKQINGNRYEGYGAFNDQMRDALIKGGLAAKTETGWITNKTGKVDSTKIVYGIRGATAGSDIILDPDKTVNYVTCHDNYTLYDRFLATGKFTKDDDAELVKMNCLANSVVLLSQGTSFFLAGEEFLRTKQGNENSYNASYEVNELDYSLKVKHLDLFKNYQELVSLKKSLSCLHMDKANAQQISVKVSDNGGLISYTLNDTVAGKQYYIAHCNGLGSEQTLNLDGYELVLSTTNSQRTLSASTTLEQYETLVAVK